VLDQSDKSLLRFQQLPMSCLRSAKRISAFVQRFCLVWPTPGRCPRRETLDDAAQQVRWRLPLTEARVWSNCRNQWQFSVYGRHCSNSSEKNGLRLQTPSRPSHIPSVSRRRGWPAEAFDLSQGQ